MLVPVPLQIARTTAEISTWLYRSNRYDLLILAIFLCVSLSAGALVGICMQVYGGACRCAGVPYRCVGGCKQVSACASKCAGVHIGVWGCMQM